MQAPWMELGPLGKANSCTQTHSLAEQKVRRGRDSPDTGWEDLSIGRHQGREHLGLSAQPSSPALQSCAGGLRPGRWNLAGGGGQGEHHSWVQIPMREGQREHPPHQLLQPRGSPPSPPAITAWSWQEATGYDLKNQSDKEMSSLGCGTKQPLKGVGDHGHQL